MAIFNVLNPLENNSPRFTEDELNIINGWFDENAKTQLIISNAEPTNVVSIERLQKFLELKKFHRRSFHYPNYAEIMTLAEKLKAGITKMLNKNQFIYMLDTWVLEPDLKHELLLAFKIFDPEKRNFLDIEEIQGIVTGYGDVFDEVETVEMLRDANVRGDGNVFYEDFVESMFSKAPELLEIKASFLYDNADEDPSVPLEPIIEVPSVAVTETIDKKSTVKKKGKRKK